MEFRQLRIRGAMVARLTPDQKVACSIHVGFNPELRIIDHLFHKKFFEKIVIKFTV